MEMRWDKDGVVYVDDPNHHDKYVIFQDLSKLYNVESRRFGPIKKFENLTDAFMFVHESVNS